MEAGKACRWHQYRCFFFDEDVSCLPKPGQCLTGDSLQHFCHPIENLQKE